MTLPAFIPTIADCTDGMCRYPLGEPTHDMPVCGAPSDGPWCPEHRRIVYVPAPKPRVYAR